MTKTKLIIEKFNAYFTRKVTKFGNGAKINCPKKYLNKKVIVIVENES